ncbi:MAG TPA: hypothetical protein VFF04_03165 [Candidatus Babeliales bacterium]|nr:hypothetical protein [Candidatus Babeliales bacterium]
MKSIVVLLFFVSISINGFAPDSSKARFDKAFKETRSLAFQIGQGERTIRKLEEDPTQNADQIIALSRIVDKSKRGWLSELYNAAHLFMAVPAEQFARPWAELKREWDAANSFHQQKSNQFKVQQDSISRATKLFLEKRQHMQCASADQMRKAWTELRTAEAISKNVERKIVFQLQRSSMNAVTLAVSCCAN